MVTADIETRPDTFDRVDRIKEAFGIPVLPGDERFWILGSPLTVRTDGELVEVPTGFTTDGASVPGWAQAITGWKPWDDPQRWAGITHDYLYARPDTTKRFGDDVFRAVLVSEGASRFRSTVMYLAVHLAGGSAYRGNQARGPRIFTGPAS